MFFSLFLVLTTYNSVEAKPINKDKKVKTEKLEEGRIINISCKWSKRLKYLQK